MSFRTSTNKIQFFFFLHSIKVCFLLLVQFLFIVSGNVEESIKNNGNEIESLNDERKLNNYGFDCPSGTEKCQKAFRDGRVMHRRLLFGYCRETCMLDLGQNVRGGWLGWNCGRCD